MKCLMELDSQKFGLTWTEKLAYLGYKFAQQSDDILRCPVTHHVQDGMYIREMTIPAGLMFVGRPHLLGHRCELVSGQLLLITQDAKTHMEAPAELVSRPGYMMCLYSKTDVVGRTYHPLDTFDWGVGLADIPAIERQLFGTVDELMRLGADVCRKIDVIEAAELFGDRLK